MIYIYNIYYLYKNAPTFSPHCFDRYASFAASIIQHQRYMGDIKGSLKKQQQQIIYSEEVCKLSSIAIKTSAQCMYVRQ
jgi:hypothetical protein